MGYLWKFYILNMKGLGYKIHNPVSTHKVTTEKNIFYINPGIDK